MISSYNEWSPLKKIVVGSATDANWPVMDPVFAKESEKTTWEHRQTLKSEHSFKAYLFTIALNQIRKYFNKKAISLRYLESLRNDTETIDDQNYQTDDYESILQQVNVIIQQMPARRREIFTKSKLEGKSSKEIAAELNISVGTVDNQVSGALHFIRSQLKCESNGLLLFAFLFIY